MYYPYLGLVLVDADDVLSDIEVRGLVALVQHHEEQVEAAHDGRADLHVRLEGLGAVVAAVQGVGRGEDGRPGVEGGLDTGLCDGDRLLLHRLVDGHLYARGARGGVSLASFHAHNMRTVGL